VYGTVRTVVWEDGGREAASYPMAIGRVNQVFRARFKKISYSLILYARAIAKAFAILGKYN